MNERDPTWAQRCLEFMPPNTWTLEAASVTLRLRVRDGVVIAAVNEWCADRREEEPSLIGCSFAPDALLQRMADPELRAELMRRLADRQ
ncbi:MAG: hypothetical protein M9963_02435 [Kiritimatiellae bacterium]|nr:hypothetical protein [Kiritimatiellia bacterium]